MAYNNGIDGKALLDEISKVIDAAANQYHEAGEDAGEEYVKGVVDGIKKHSKEAKSEITKMYEEFNKATNNFKSRKSITNEDWSRVLGLSKELLKSERYADSVRDKLNGISATFKNIGKVSGLDKIIAELDKAENKLETVAWAEAGKNYKKRTTTARKPKVETPVVQADPAPVVKAENKKQDAIDQTTTSLREQVKATEDAASAQEKYNKRVSEIKDKYNGDISKQKQLISNQEAWIKYLNRSLDESKFKTGGKKEATDQLRSLTNYMVNGRRNNYANDPGEWPKEMAEVAWMRGYQEAERQGVADSVLRRFDTDARYNFDSNLKTLQEEYDYRKKVMDVAYEELQRLYLERDKEAFAAFSDKLMPDGPQSDEESRILSEITEQVANKTLSYTDAKANLEKSIMTLRNMASSEAKVNLQNLVDDLKKTYDAETFDKVFGADFNMFASFDKIDDTGAKELYDALIESNQKYQASLVKTVETQQKLNDGLREQQKIASDVEADKASQITAQDRLVKVESELEAKKSRNKDLAAETEQVEKEFDNILTQHGVKTRFLGQGRFIDPDHLHEAYKGQSLAFADRKGVGDSDIAQALYQIARFPEKYGGTRISEEEGRQYYGDKRVNADAIIPFGDGRRVLFGTGVQYIGGPYKRNDQAIPKTINDNNDVIASSNGGYVSYEAMAKNPKLYLGMSEDELKQLPIIKRAYNDYQTQLDEDNVIRTLLHNLGNSAPEHIDILRPLFDKLSGLRQEQLQNQESIARLTEERQTIEQEISLESQPNHDKTEEILAQVEAQKQLNQVQQEQQNIQSKNIADQTNEEKHDTKLFEDENGQVALFDGISSSVQQATEDTKELKNELKSIEILEGQIGIDDYKATAAQDALETPSDELKETFDIIQQGESVTGKFVTTANTVHEALENMRNALPEEKQAWGEYIDNILAQDDDKMIDEFKSIRGSMGDRSELYKMENLGDGRVEVTFSGIREEIEATADTAEQSKKSLQDVLELIDKMSSKSGESDAFNKRHKALIDKANNLTSGVDYDQLYSQLIENENTYQQELEETNRINKEREGQLDAYAQAAGAFLGDNKYDGVSFDDKNKLFENFGNKIMQDGISASDAMDQLYLSMEKLIQQSKEMPDDVIESFGADSEHVAETVSQLQKLSSIDLTRIFDSVDLKNFLQAFNIDQSNFAAFRKLFEELMQITNAMANGVDVGNAFNSKMDEITNTIMRLGGNMVDLDDAGYATMMQDFYKHMSNTKVQFNDGVKSDYTKDQWKSLYNTYKNRLTADVTKGISADSLYHELSGLWPSLFPEGVLNEKDQFKLIIEKLDEARRLQADNWKVLQGFTPENRDDIQNSVDNLYNQMSQSLYADTSANELQSEADAFKEVEQSAIKAANAKGKFSQKNKELGDGAAESSDDLDDEAESLENVNRAAANLPDVSAYDSTTVRYDTNGNPYSVSGTSRQEMIDGTHVRSTDNYQFDAENNRWDYMGTVQSSERTREMVQALEEYYRILNQIQKLRLDPSSAIHTEEINKLETDDLARAYQRVCDLGIQVNDIEGQINLSVNQRRALLDVELRARQEMYDVIAKMEDKQATAATKPFQKTVADEIKKAANIDTNVRLLGDDGASDRLQSQIADYRRMVDELVDMRLQLARNSDLTNDVDFSNRFADTAKRAENARVAIEGVFKESQKLQKLGTLITTGSKDVSNVQNLKSEMIEFANSALDGEVKINGFNTEGNLMYATLTKAGGAVENITVALNRATGHLHAFSTGTSKATNEWEDFKAKAVDGAKNILGMYVGFQEGVQALRTGVEYVKEIDLAMTELKKVTDETDASYKEFLQDAAGTSSIIGSTIRDFTEATATFARLGYTLEESSSMAETAIIYKNVADGLDTVEESSESIISTMMAFGIEANDTMSIIDRFNAVGKICADYKVA